MPWAFSRGEVAGKARCRKVEKVGRAFRVKKGKVRPGDAGKNKARKSTCLCRRVDPEITR